MRSKPLSRKKNGKPRKAPGKATGKSLTRRTEMLAKAACLDRCGHKCMAIGHLDHECAPRMPGWGLLEWAHILTRRYVKLKFHPDNSVALCGKAHQYYTDHPLEWQFFIEKIHPGRWEKLLEHDRNYPKGANAEFWADYYKEAGYGVRGKLKEKQ